MTAESNVRKVIAPDMAFSRWHAGCPTVPSVYLDPEGWVCGTDDRDRAVFLAGYEAAIRDVAEARET